MIEPINDEDLAVLERNLLVANENGRVASARLVRQLVARIHEKESETKMERARRFGGAEGHPDAMKEAATFVDLHEQVGVLRCERKRLMVVAREAYLTSKEIGYGNGFTRNEGESLRMLSRKRNVLLHTALVNLNRLVYDEVVMMAENETKRLHEEVE